MTDRIAVVTGGASGMGRATCLELAKRGCPVAVLDLDGEAAGEVAERLRSSGAGALGIGVDVADRPAVNEAFAKVRADLGPVSILVTSAGLTGFVSFREITLDSWHRMLEVNLTGTFNCCQAAIDDMVATGWGRIVTISSSSAQRGSPRMAHYAASKGGVIALTKSLAKETASKDISVNCLTPAAARTALFDQMTQQHIDFMLSKIPRGRFVTVDEIASLTAFCASAECSFTTGAVFDISGGRATY